MGRLQPCPGRKTSAVNERAASENVYMHIYIYIHIHVYIYIHTYIYTHM